MNSLDLHGWQWALAALGAFLIGLSKTGFAGMGVFAVALYANLLGARQSTGVILPMLVCADVVAVAAFRRHAVWSHLWKLFPWVAAGVVAGYFAMGRANDLQVRRGIGVILLVMMAVHFWWRRRGESVANVAVPHTLWFAAVTGMLAGFTTMMANAAGPIMVLYLFAVGLPKMEFLGTGAWFFLIINLFKVPFSYRLGLVTGPTLMFNAWLCPAVIAGALLGRLIIRHVNQQLFENIVLGFTLVAVLRLLF